jgi:hypothetical protein
LLVLNNSTVCDERIKIDLTILGGTHSLLAQGKSVLNEYDSAGNQCDDSNPKKPNRGRI